jgi:Histone methylation protein DOT1
MSSERRTRAAIVRKFHQGSAEATDSILESALRIAPGDEDRDGALPALLQRYGNQNFSFFGGTPFHEVREIFRAIDPQPHDVFCDAGAGYGHVVFYGACVAPCRFRAIEILPVRCVAMRRTAQRLGLPNVEIVEGDALTQNYGDVSYLLLNSPFFPEIAAQFIGTLTASRNRRLTVIAMNNIVDAFRQNNAFTEIDIEVDIPNYRFAIFRFTEARRSVRRP